MQNLRSRSNIMCKIGQGNSTLIAKFMQEVQAAGFVGLTEVAAGSCCITLNNHTPFEGVFALIALMNTFKSQNSP